MEQSKDSKTPRIQDQLCFALYTTSRAFTKTYATLLEEMGVTYPQYLVLLVLFEKENQTIQQIADDLKIESATATPLIKRMEALGLVTRQRSVEDERRVLVSLTQKGLNYRNQTMEIPEKLGCLANISEPQAQELIKELNEIRAQLG